MLLDPPPLGLLDLIIYNKEKSLMTRIGNDILSNLLLSPRAHNLDGSFIACESCLNNIAYSNAEVPPKFAISNG